MIACEEASAEAMSEDPMNDACFWWDVTEDTYK